MIVFILNLFNVAFLYQGIDLVRRIRCGNAHHNGKFLYCRFTESLDALYAVAFYSRKACLSLFKLGEDLHVEINSKFVIQILNRIS